MWGGNRDEFPERKKEKYAGHQVAQSVLGEDKDDCHKAIPTNIAFPLFPPSSHALFNSNSNCTAF